MDILNINDLSGAQSPSCCRASGWWCIVKPGEEAGQGVGYLEDGTMVVVEHGRPHLNEDVEFIVTRALQTSAGRMIFGRLGGDGLRVAVRVEMREAAVGTEGAASPGRPAEARPAAPHGPPGRTRNRRRLLRDRCLSANGRPDSAPDARQMRGRAGPLVDLPNTCAGAPSILHQFRRLPVAHEVCFSRPGGVADRAPSHPALQFEKTESGS